MVEIKGITRVAKETKTFKAQGIFNPLNAAKAWLTENGYSYGSTSKDRKTFANCPIAIQKGKYAFSLPQKWTSLTEEQINEVDGIMVSTDFREGEVTVHLYN